MTSPYAAPPSTPRPARPPRKRWPWIVGAVVALAAVVGTTVAITRAAAPQPVAVVTPSAPVSMAPPSSSPAASATSSTTTDSGFLQKKIGERAGMSSPDGTVVVFFYVTKITVDPKCDAYSQRPAGKHTLLVEVSVQTQKFLKDSDRSDVSVLLNPFAFQTRGTDGTTHPAAAGTCLMSAKRLPDNYAPNSKYTGQIDLEVDDASGALLLSPTGLGNGSGWEWKI